MSWQLLGFSSHYPCAHNYTADFIAAPYPITKNLEAIYEIVAARNPAIRGHKPEEFVDASFVAELDKSGFIKKLYEQK